MFGRCGVCQEKVPLITIKDGNLFSNGNVYEVCYEHTTKKYMFNNICTGSNMRPIAIWTDTPINLIVNPN